jgi:L-2-hydroxyglutarate oxidase LhgO
MYKIIIIGAGVIGLSVARAISMNSKDSVLVIEKEESYGHGISSRNSEVIHSGIYYKPNSLKASYCTLGRELIYDYCKKNHVWSKNCGKLVVGNKHQSSALEALYKNARSNNVPNIRIIDKKEIQKLEKNVDSDLALYVGSTGIVSAHDLMTAFYKDSQSKDHDYLFKSEVISIKQLNQGYELSVRNAVDEIETVSCEWVINAAGLQSDIIANMLPEDFPSLKYSKGSYFKLASKWRNAFKHLIYPLPDKTHGSLGVHLTLDQTGSAKLGPNAQWLEDRNENYNVDMTLIDHFFNEAKLYIKGLKKEDLSPDYAGIRPKILIKDNPMPDFYISHEEDKGYPGWINLIGIESPGLTASIAIGNDIAKLVS